MKKKKKFNFIKFSIIILIILVVIYILLDNATKTKVKEEDAFRYHMTPDEEIEHLEEDVILANNSYKFFSNYYNKIDAKDIQENWDNFVRIVVPKYCKQIDSLEDASDYYKNNQDDILKETGIENEKSFIELMDKITFEYHKQPTEIKDLEILDDAQYNSESNITTTRIKATYDKDIELIFNISVYDEKDEQGIFIEYK